LTAISWSDDGHQEVRIYYATDHGVFELVTHDFSAGNSSWVISGVASMRKDNYNPYGQIGVVFFNLSLNSHDGDHIRLALVKAESIDVSFKCPWIRVLKFDSWQ
jgi:hypothetical protein